MGNDETALVDPMTDVIHLADRLGFRPDEIAFSAEEHYHTEILEER
jgi:hypothetical protein